MRQVRISDIHKRLNNLRSSETASSFLAEAATSLVNTGRPCDIKRYIESTIQSGQIAPFYVYISLYEAIIDRGSIGDIKKVGNYIAEEVVPKTRDAKETQTFLKRKIGNIKRKSNPDINKTISKLSNKYNAGIASNPKKSIANPAAQKAKQEATLDCYNNMLEESMSMAHCDRVIENYDKISRRFNLDLLFTENSRINGIEDTVVELCHRIDTYNMPTVVKFNTVIETAWYGFESNSINYTKSQILETACDYFAFKEDGVKACNDILDATLFFDKNEDMGDIDIITEEEPEDDAITEGYVDKDFSTVYLDKYNTDGSLLTEESNQPDANDTEFEKIFKKFKREELAKDKSPQNKLSWLIRKLYSRSVDGVIKDTPKLLSWLRSFFILGTGAIPVIGPVIMVIGLIADRFIDMHMERKEVEDMIKCFNQEIKTSKTKLDSLNDNEQKEKMNKYIKSLQDAKKKIEDYYDQMLTSDELTDRYNKIYEDPDDDDISDVSDDDIDAFMNDDDDFNFDFDDFKEGAAIVKLSESIEELLNYDISDVNDKSMYTLVTDVDSSEITSIAALAAKYPEQFYKESVSSAIDSNLTDIRRGKVQYSVVEKAYRVEQLQAAKAILENTPSAQSVIDVYEAEAYMEGITEAYSAICMMINAIHEKDNPLLEASFSNTLKMASIKLKQAMQKLSDKEKSISRSIDLGVNNIKKAAERALTNDNRESIIKGSILPSASKVVKLGILNAGLIAIGQPVIAVIATLGYLGTSAKFKAKERQMLVDEIEIELKMCQKYIDIAESKNDMKALKQLLMIQRDLERQRQRIKYKMKVELGQKYYDTTGVDD